MAICEYCGKEMLDNVGCSCEKIEYDLNKYTRIKTGDKNDFVRPCEVCIEYDLNKYTRIKAGDKNDFVRPGEVCHDCGAPYGTYHHPGCDAERCPRCGGQLISCNCKVRRIIPIYRNKEVKK